MVWGGNSAKRPKLPKNKEKGAEMSTSHALKFPLASGAMGTFGAAGALGAEATSEWEAPSGR